MVSDTDFVYLTHNETTVLQAHITDARDTCVLNLFLSTGIFLNEAEGLTLKDVDLENKTLRVGGKRKRNLPLNNQSIACLNAWLGKRLTCKTDALFITTKGKPKALSARSLDHLIRKYAKQAGIKKQVNTRVLRHTYAVRLFEAGLSDTQVASLLGVSDQDFTHRYQLIKPNLSDTHTQNPITQENAVATLDHRSIAQKVKDKFFRVTPKTKKTLSTLDGQITTHPSETIFGKTTLIRDTLACLKKAQSVILIGPKGSGKTHILLHIHIQLGSGLYLNMTRPLKKNLAELAFYLDPNYASQLPTRPVMDDYIHFIQDHPKLQNTILILDSIDTLSSTAMNMIDTLVGKATILTSATESKKKISHLLPKFKAMDVTPLTEDAARELTRYLTQNMPVTDYELLETYILEKSNRYPGAIVNNIHQLYYEPVVDSDAIRQLPQDSNTQYRDWSVAIVILWGILIMLRFVAMGTHSVEGYILAGFGTSILITAKFFARKMS